MKSYLLRSIAYGAGGSTSMANLKQEISVRSHALVIYRTSLTNLKRFRQVWLGCGRNAAWFVHTYRIPLPCRPFFWELLCNVREWMFPGVGWFSGLVKKHHTMFNFFNHDHDDDPYPISVSKFHMLLKLMRLPATTFHFQIANRVGGKRKHWSPTLTPSPRAVTVTDPNGGRTWLSDQTRNSGPSEFPDRII